MADIGKQEVTEVMEQDIGHTQDSIRKNPNKRRQQSDLVETATRRAFVLELRKAGITYRAIVQAAVKKFGEENLPSGYDCRAAALDVRRVLEKLNRDCQHDVAEIRRLELERVDVAMAAIWRSVRAGHLAAIDRFVKLSARRARLAGLDMPTDVDIKSGGDKIRLLVGGIDLANDI